MRVSLRVCFALLKMKKGVEGTHEEHEGPFETDAKGLHERLLRHASIVNRDVRLANRLLELLGLPTEDDAGVCLGEGDGGRDDDDGGENRYYSVDPPPAGMNGQRVRDVSSNDGLARSGRRGCQRGVSLEHFRGRQPSAYSLPGLDRGRERLEMKGRKRESGTTIWFAGAGRRIEGVAIT